MRYKVGDKVKVREDLVAGIKYGNNTFVEEMKELLGEVVTIDANDYGDGYGIEEDTYNWTEEMLEPISLKEKVLQNHVEVVTREGLKGIVSYGQIPLSEGSKQISIKLIKEDLTHKIDKLKDIMKATLNGEVIYERKKEVDWNKVERGTPVMVRDYDCDSWDDAEFVCYAKGYVEEFVVAFDGHTCGMKQCKLK